MTDTRPTPADELVERVARTICLVDAGDKDPSPVPDALMPNNWYPNRALYEVRARAVVALVIDQVSDLTFLIPLIEKQSEGEWPDSLIASDARMFSTAIRAIDPARIVKEVKDE